MKVNQNILKIAESALSGLDRVGYELDMYGVTSKVNRHNLIGQVLAGQKQMEGELDSLTARFDSAKVKVERTVDRVEGLVNNSISFALAPVRGTISSVKGLIAK